MSPLVRRMSISVLVIGVLSITLFAAPAHAVGARVSQWQDTPSWSVFSLDFWMDFASSLFSIDRDGGSVAMNDAPNAPSTIFEEVKEAFEPDGVAITSGSPDSTLISVTGGN